MSEVVCFVKLLPSLAWILAAISAPLLGGNIMLLLDCIAGILGLVSSLLLASCLSRPLYWLFPMRILLTRAYHT